MAILKKITMSSLSQRVAVAGVLLLGVTGCVLFGLMDDTLAFSHLTHSTTGMECTDCHEFGSSSAMPAPITLELCEFCHEDLDTERPADRAVKFLFVNGEFQGTGNDRYADEVLFSHDDHSEQGLSCAECHEGIEDVDRIGADQAIAMADCVSCHESSQIEANDCSSCHEEIDQGFAPAGHERNWTRAHGLFSHGDSDDTASQCSLCHSESSCKACHFEMEPASHNNTWRLRTHGIGASLDRTGCAVCHEPASCESCHLDTRPRSHRPNFGSTKNTHCVSCHEPLAASSCSVCHKGTPSHLLAAPKPPGHNAGQDCRQCHGVDVPLPHVDNGTNCNFCHQ